MKRIERYEKDGNAIEVNSLMTLNDSVIDIKQIFILNNIVYVCFDTVVGRILTSEPADDFIEKNKEYLSTLTKKAIKTDTTCKCKKCQ